MKKALVEIVHDSEPQYPNDTGTYDRIDVGTIKNWISILSENSIDEVVFVAEDCFAHSDLWDIVNYTLDTFIERVKIMTTGDFMMRDEIYEFRRENVSCIVPISFEDPFNDIIYGQNNHGRETEMIIANIPDVEMWHTLNNSKEGLQYASQVAAMGNEYSADIFIDVINGAPKEFIESYEQVVNFRQKDDWKFAYHGDKEIPDNTEFENDLIIGKKNYSGSLFIDYSGNVSTIDNKEGVQIENLSKDGLRAVSD